MGKIEPCPPLSLEQLETGLRLLGMGDLDRKAFWDQNIEAFRRTVLFAIRETSDALLSPRITLPWQVRLERQLESLVGYVELADRYIERRALSREAWAPASELRRSRVH